MHFRAARWTLVVTARRFAQVEWDAATVSITKTRAIDDQRRYLFTCAGPTESSDGPDELVPLPGVDLPVDSPRLAVGDPGEPGVRSQVTAEDLEIEGHRMTLDGGSELAVPMTFHGDGNDRWFRLVVTLTVNGRSVRYELGDGDQPIGITWALLQRGPADYEWRPGDTGALIRNTPGS
jgi:hypothetical protein